MAFANVEGTVSRINQNGIGFSVEEAWEGRDGRSGRRFWSVWLPDDKPVTVTVGDRVKVSGALGTKVSTRDARYVDHTLNRATVDVTAAAAPAVQPAVPDPFAGAQWDTATPGWSPAPDETPF